MLLSASAAGSGHSALRHWRTLVSSARTGRPLLWPIKKIRQQGSWEMLAPGLARCRLPPRALANAGSQSAPAFPAQANLVCGLPLPPSRHLRPDTGPRGPSHMMDVLSEAHSSPHSSVAPTLSRATYAASLVQPCSLLGHRCCVPWGSSASRYALLKYAGSIAENHSWLFEEL